MNAKNLLAGLCLATIALGCVTAVSAKPAAPAAAPTKEAAPAKAEKAEKADKKADKSDKKGGVAVGDKAPSFSLTSYDGKDVKLDELLKTNKAVVIQWFNAECPFVKMHYENGANTFNDLQKEFGSKGVAVVGINSGAPGQQGHGADLNKKYIADWKISYPILADESGEIGRAYGAKNTPAMFIVTADGKVAYSGAIDNNQGRDKKGADVKNYVKTALEEILSGKAVTTASTTPYGCSVKYGKK